MFSFILPSKHARICMATCRTVTFNMLNSSQKLLCMTSAHTVSLPWMLRGAIIVQTNFVWSSYVYTRVFRQLFLYITQPTIAVLINVEILQMNSQLLLWSWKVAECSLIDNLIAKKLILATFRLDAPVLLSYINVGKMFSVYKNQPPPNPLTVQILSGITKFMKLLGIWEFWLSSKCWKWLLWQPKCQLHLWWNLSELWIKKKCLCSSLQQS